MFLAIPVPTLIDAIPIPAHVAEAPAWKTTSLDTAPTTAQPTTTSTAPTGHTTTTITPTSPTTHTPATSLTMAMCFQVGPGPMSEPITCQQRDGYIVTAKRADILPKDTAYEAGLKDQLCEVKPWFCQ